MAIVYNTPHLGMDHVQVQWKWSKKLAHFYPILLPILILNCHVNKQRKWYLWECKGIHKTNWKGYLFAWMLLKSTEYPYARHILKQQKDMYTPNFSLKYIEILEAHNMASTLR